MHYDYVVILKRENASKTDMVSLLLLIFSLFAFSFAQIRYGAKLFLCFAMLIIIAALLVNGMRYRKHDQMQFRNWLFAAGLFWIGMPYLQWLALLFFIFALMEAQAKYPLEIGFYTEGVVINTLFKKKFPWNSFVSVILKEGLLTLDFKNNTLIQKEVMDDDEPDANEDEFNDYCRSKLVNLR